MVSRYRRLQDFSGAAFAEGATLASRARMSEAASGVLVISAYPLDHVTETTVSHSRGQSSTVTAIAPIHYENAE
jgi:hypothetical protein